MSNSYSTIRSAAIPIVKLIIGVSLFAYLCSMFIYPFIEGDWQSAQRVWSSWQGLNVGVLAFTSSVIAFYISRYKAEQQRKRDFVAARAFLPEALSELTGYFSKCTTSLLEAYERAIDEDDRCESKLNSSIPNLPTGYKAVFSQCIKTAKDDVGEHLAYILTHLQIHHSRLESLHSDFSPNSSMLIRPENLRAKIVSLGVLQALINKTFGFARGTADFDASPLTKDEVINGLTNMGLKIEITDKLLENVDQLSKTGFEET